jgi:hypothetical protein
LVDIGSKQGGKYSNKTHSLICAWAVY